MFKNTISIKKPICNLFFCSNAQSYLFLVKNKIEAKNGLLLTLKINRHRGN